MKLHSVTDFTDRLKGLAPPFTRRMSRHAKAVIRTWRNRNLSAQEVFTRVYAENMWGTGNGEFYSGPGSNEEAATPYADFVKDFVAEQKINSIVDLGCGDFRVGRRIASAGVNYTGVDVVKPLIDGNNLRYGDANTKFVCLDIATDALPDGELCLIREVFQHISNAQITAVLPKLKKYKHVLFTDMQPEDSTGLSVNRDKVHGDSSRLIHKSCLQLNAPPFNVRDIRMVFETIPPCLELYSPYQCGFKLRTFLLQP